ncbi:MAG: tetratricopeptide repeat protein [Oscillatoriophycideae cyanobacterium NC_groundwater_1537_Pr4_S-0.65um_50_18]|nr:tetratricopeptide repeat protein [Oscillatoriophycideae cyanobacterium NC_groundwater_1537_Pr4_S-0.65um_50_18]
MHNLPYGTTVQVVGREAELTLLHSRLQASDRPVLALQGVDGIGKTALVLRYAYDSWAQSFYPGGVCWLRSQEDIGTQIVCFARAHLNLQPPVSLNLLEQVAYCWAHWPEGTLLTIWDDVVDYGQIQPYLPPQSDRFKVLLTTPHNLGVAVQSLPLEGLREDAALELLKTILPESRIAQQLADAKTLCNRLDYLPLSLELVAGYLRRKPDLAIATLLQSWPAQSLETYALKQIESKTAAALGVAAALELSWQDLSETAQRLAGLISLFALAPIPWELVEACFSKAYAQDLVKPRDQELIALHLLQRSDQDRERYQLHRLVREFFAAKHQEVIPVREGHSVEDWLKLLQPLSTTQQQQDIIAVAMKQTVACVVVHAAQPISPTPTLTQIAQFATLMPHLSEVATAFTTCLADDILTIPATRIAGFYQLQSASAQAESWLQQARTAAESRFGKDHLSVAQSLNHLAEFYRSLGRYGEAEPLLARSLSILESQLGMQHRSVAQSLNNLAELYRSLGRYGEAEPLLTRSLSILESQLSADHLDIATSLNSLAVLYSAQGRYSEAEPLLARSLSIRESQLGANHAQVATSLNNLAELYRSIGRYGEAESLLVRSLSIRESQLGADHPEVAQSLNSMALLYAVQGNFSEAEPFYLRAVAILGYRLGKTHPNTQVVWKNLMSFLQQVIQAGQTTQLSQHPVTQKLLAHLAHNPGNLS